MRSLVYAIVLLSAEVALATEIDVTSWVLRSRVRAEGVGEAVDGTNTIQNPFHKIDHAELPLPNGATSTADSEYFASWDADGFLDFLVTGQHTAAGHSSSIFSRSTGHIEFTPNVDSMLSIQSTYSYLLAPGLRTALLHFSVFQGLDTPLFYESEVRDALGGNPPGGTINISGQVPLFANTAYSVNYAMELEGISGNPNQLSTGNGSVFFQITPVPEPATLALITLLTPALLRSRRR